MEGHTAIADVNADNLNLLAGYNIKTAVKRPWRLSQLILHWQPLCIMGMGCPKSNGEISALGCFQDSV